MFLEISNEIARKSQVKKDKLKLERLEEIKTNYRDFIHNVTKSKIREVYTPEAQQTIKEVEELKGRLSTRYLNFDFDVVNKDLRLIYALRGFK